VTNASAKKVGFILGLRPRHLFVFIDISGDDSVAKFDFLDGVHDSGDLRLKGGQIADYLIADGNSTVEIYGSGFTYDPTGGNVGMGLIEGFWLDGSQLSISLATVPGSGDDTYSHITFLPEPAALMLLAIGGTTAFRRRRAHSFAYRR